MVLLEALTFKFELFLIVMFRIAGMLFLLPVFNEPSIPKMAKAAIAALVSFVVVPMVLDLPLFLPTGLGELVLALTGELMIGIMAGFMILMVFGAIQLSGQLIGFQMGFAVVNVIDPASGSNVSLINRFEILIATMLFLVLNMHHWFIGAIIESFQTIPPLGFVLTLDSLRMILNSAAQMFVVSVKIGAPVIITLFVTKVAIGIIAKTVPQMNIFIVGFPLTIGLGLIMLGLSMPVFEKEIVKYMHVVVGSVSRLLAVMS